MKAWTRKTRAFALVVAGLLAGCGGGGGGDSPPPASGDGTAGTSTSASTTKQIDVSGKIDLPGYAETGVRWLRVRDPGSATALYEGPTTASGGYSATVTVPAALDRLLVEATMPENPGAIGMAVASLGSGTDAKGLGTASAASPKGIPVLIDVDAKSTAHAISLGALGRLKQGPITLATDEQALATRMAALLDSDGAQFCAINGGTESVGATLVGRPTAPWRDELPALLAKWQADSRTRFDDVLRTRGLSAAQQEVTNGVLPGNRFGRGFGWANVDVSSVRSLIRAAVPVLTQDGYNDDIESYVLPYADLARIAEIVLYHGRGNCRENGMVGAYLASRIANFKQVATFAIHGDRIGPDYDHALALACRKGADTYDIYKWNFSAITASTNALNRGLLSAECTVIDPWIGETIPLAAFLDKNVGYQVSAVMRIALPPDSERIVLSDTLLNASPPATKVLATKAGERGECHFGSPPDTCSAIRIAGTELCGDEIDNDGDGQVDEGCPPAAPVTDYVVWKMDNVACWSAPRVYATDRAGFDRSQRTCDIPGGGINCNLAVDKVPLRDGFETLARAQSWFCGQIKTNWYHYWCNDRGARVETPGGALYTLAIPCDLSKVPFEYP